MQIFPHGDVDMWDMWNFPVFRGGGGCGACVMVTGLSENLGTRLKLIFYPKYYTFILK